MKIINRIPPNTLGYFQYRMRWCFEVLKYYFHNRPFDIIEAPEWGNSTLFISLLYPSSKIVVRLHRSYYQYQKDNQLPISFDRWLVCTLELLSILVAHAVTSPTKYLLNEYHFFYWYWNLRGIKRKVIPNGIDVQNSQNGLTTRAKSSYILFIGRIEIAKGVFTLIQAFQLFTSQHSKVKLLIIGTDTLMFIEHKWQSYKTYLRKYIKQNKLKNITFLKNKKHTNIQIYLKNCLFLVAPSVGHENHPMILLEAMSLGKTFIGSNTGGLPEIIKDHYNGLLFQPENSVDLAKKITFMINNPDFRKLCEQQNDQLMTKFNIKKTVQTTRAFYKDIQ